MKITQQTDYQLLALECLKGSRPLLADNKSNLVVFEQKDGSLTTTQLQTKALYKKMDLQVKLQDMAGQVKNISKQINPTVKGLLNAGVIDSRDAQILKNVCEQSKQNIEADTLTK